MYYYELHMHTSDTSRCGKSPAADMVAAYKQKGFTGVVEEIYTYYYGLCAGCKQLLAGSAPDNK